MRRIPQAVGAVPARRRRQRRRRPDAARGPPRRPWRRSSSRHRQPALGHPANRHAGRPESAPWHIEQPRDLRVRPICGRVPLAPEQMGADGTPSRLAIVGQARPGCSPAPKPPPPVHGDRHDDFEPVLGQVGAALLDKQSGQRFGEGLLRLALDPQDRRSQHALVAAQPHRGLKPRRRLATLWHRLAAGRYTGHVRAHQGKPADALTAPCGTARRAKAVRYNRYGKPRIAEDKPGRRRAPAARVPAERQSPTAPTNGAKVAYALSMPERAALLYSRHFLTRESEAAKSAKTLGWRVRRPMSSLPRGGPVGQGRIVESHQHQLVAGWRSRSRAAGSIRMVWPASMASTLAAGRDHRFRASPCRSSARRTACPAAAWPP